MMQPHTAFATPAARLSPAMLGLLPAPPGEAMFRDLVLLPGEGRAAAFPAFSRISFRRDPRQLWIDFDACIAASQPAPPLPIVTPPPRPKREPAEMTPVMGRLLGVLERLAAAASELPPNPVLASLAGDCGRNTVLRGLERLERIGRVRLEIDGAKRRFVIAATGLATGWGGRTTGHAPYSRYARGETPEARPVRPDYRPEEGTPFRFRVDVRPLVETKPAARCQWPLWEKITEPSHKYCDKPTAPYPGTHRRSSYCADHVTIAFGPEDGGCA